MAELHPTLWVCFTVPLPAPVTGGEPILFLAEELLGLSDEQNCATENLEFT